MNFKEFKTYLKLMEISLSAISTYFYFKKKTFQREKKNLNINWYYTFNESVFIIYYAENIFPWIWQLKII